MDTVNSVVSLPHQLLNLYLVFYTAYYSVFLKFLQYWDGTQGLVLQCLTT
jgi:hypothetical protein